jgi:hypothetical protein
LLRNHPGRVWEKVENEKQVSEKLNIAMALWKERASKAAKLSAVCGDMVSSSVSK